MSTQTPAQPDDQAREEVSIAGWIARAVAVLIFLPPRLLWEGLKALWRAVVFTGRMIVTGLRYLRDRLLVPAGKLFWYWVIRPAWFFVKDYLWGLLIQQLLWGMILTPIGAFLLDFLLRPLRRAVEDWLWRKILRPAFAWFFTKALPAVADAIWRWLLRPIGLAVLWVVGAIAWAVKFLITWVLIWPVQTLWRTVIRPASSWIYTVVLAPSGRWFVRWIVHPLVRGVQATARAVVAALTFLGIWLVVWPLQQLWRWIVRPLLLLLVATAVIGWRGATYVVRVLVVTPCRYLYRTVLRPTGILLARAWEAMVQRPIHWAYRRVITPMNRWAADAIAMVFGR
ncbi:hypothetical protein [Nocardia huaxiensis]|uniref:hypothetical protein n=1 Tax=Nocardia huaxiensis TaxID=2755382 RepID=UPI001E4E2B47|nr:hypothetical protein [Nocardia huaxiensis]UFS98827.1 hypothetical protein LPY97_13495 [Nocardia huaxiensis]